MSLRRKLNIATIGCGFMGRAHSNAFRQANGFFETPFEPALKILCGLDKAIEQKARDWGWQEAVTDWESVVHRPDIDVIDICTPNYLHAPIAIEAARAGKIVYSEKPLASTVAEAEQMVEATKNLPTLAWFNYRRVPAIRLAHQLIDEGRIGNVYHYRGLYLQSWGKAADPEAWRFQPKQAGSGVSGDLLSHSLDLALFLNGPIRRLVAQTSVFAQGRKVDDAVSVLAEFANGSMGTFEASRFATGNQNRNSVEINGSDGCLEFNLEKMNHLAYNDLREDAAIQGRREILVTGPGHPYVDRFWPPGHTIGWEHTFIATFVDFLFALSRGERFRPDFADALGVQRLLELVSRSAHQGSWIEVPQETATAPA